MTQAELSFTRNTRISESASWQHVVRSNNLHISLIRKGCTGSYKRVTIVLLASVLELDAPSSRAKVSTLPDGIWTPVLLVGNSAVIVGNIFDHKQGDLYDLALHGIVCLDCLPQSAQSTQQIRRSFPHLNRHALHTIQSEGAATNDIRK